ncbi:L,D-transpeptidase catalytic domain [Jatrophihabitans endophyticus]|uniref:L,D-transpeptidase catalytic domain n=1 Tax=Jatrophihabitans endophyticus TaxID=1206085 RepID=A0A1M5G7W8_9ACTN|nr:L,D-transpeptidase [Jatrophihabitans endophyticus]SHF99845.1 L,D-transpeptidase catalytic domain [Jatrophihabitans endophyticus]
MTDDDLGRFLADAFDARARAGVGDHAVPPPPRYAGADDAPTGARPAAAAPHRPGRARWWAPLAAAAAVVAIVAGALAVTRGDEDRRGSVEAARPSVSAARSSTPPAGATFVRVTTANSDGAVYGVGMPVIAYFSQRITDARAFQQGTTVTANGRPLDTAWYFQRSAAGHGPIEAQLRPKDYWPAHAKIHVTFPARGTALGGRLATDGRLSTLDFSTAARTITTVDNTTHRVTVVSDGTRYGSFPTSLGSTATPTMRGIKVIMEKGRQIPMKGPGYYTARVQDTQRLTFGGEYLHSAPWNVDNIEAGVNSSNGCTNLLPRDARKLYGELRVGDVVTFPNATGPRMQMGQGYGLWNVAWNEYRTGGLVPTR